jgi:hypothetical protein
MARIVTTSAVTLPAALGSNGYPAQYIPKGSVLEVTAAQAAAIAAAGGTTRAVSTATQRDVLGEEVCASNTSA